MSRKLSVDESMILFKGRHSIKQYNPMKPIKRGYKLWVRADMDGYISKFDVYQGKADANASAVEEDDEGTKFGLGERVVQTMTVDLFNKNHQLFFDNYFTSVPLMKYLKTNGVNACGTIRTNRKYYQLEWMKVLIVASLIIVCHWMDLLSSNGKITDPFLFYVISMELKFHLFREPKRVVLKVSFPVL